MIYEKITEQEREQLLNKRIEQINNEKGYAMKLFETYYKNPARENYQAWNKLDDVGKIKIAKEILKKEDIMFSQFAIRKHKLNPKKAMNYIIQLKHEQLMELGIRKK